MSLLLLASSDERWGNFSTRKVRALGTKYNAHQFTAHEDPRAVQENPTGRQ